MNIKEKEEDKLAHEQPIFLISSARSGSTWVQKIINTHPGIVMWGEHAGFISDLSQSYAKVISHGKIAESLDKNFDKQNFLNKRVSDNFNPAWINPFDKESFHQKCNDYLLSFFVNGLSKSVRWGFKEIRYCDANTLSFLHKMFPDAQFIFLERDLIDVCRSQILNFHGDIYCNKNNNDTDSLINNVLASLQKEKREIALFKEKNKRLLSFLDVNYEMLVSNYSEEVSKIFNFLNLDVQLCEDELLKIQKGKVHPSRSDDFLRPRIEEIFDKEKRFEKNQDFAKNICIRKKEIFIENLKFSNNKKEEVIQKKDEEIKKIMNSKEFQVGNLLLRSLKSPLKFIKFPFNFIKKLKS